VSVGRAAVAVLAFGLLVAACSDDDATTDDTTTDDSTAQTTSADDRTDLSTFATLDALASAIDEAGYPCELEYEGLEDATGVVSLCTVGDGQATLRIWTDPADVTALADSGTATELTVYGENWTVDVRDPEVAATLATALGGTTG
jgi:hypothetical protein